MASDSQGGQQQKKHGNYSSYKFYRRNNAKTKNLW